MKVGANQQSNGQAVKFSTFAGVFTPSLLTIIGVIMFLRFNTVVGYAGFWHALGILGVAKLITLITALSLSSISTNMRVGGGGAYYLISRSLGAEFGGVIAIFFFIAQAVAVTLYVIGFTEAVFAAFPDLPISFRDVATVTNLLVFLSVYIGAGWTIKVQYGILGILGLSLLSFIIGALLKISPEAFRANLEPTWNHEYNLFTTFALFFPAATGIMAGVNMSGDLEDPSRSIPRGTLAAIGTAALVYAILLFLLAISVPRDVLLSSGFVMKDQAIWGPLIYAGVFAATISSALGSMMGAPRVLQAFARDRIFRPLNIFARGSGPSEEPRNAIILTFLVAQAGIMAGDLNTIAPVITLFFLITYGMVNLACFYEIFSRNPSFRPTFKINHWVIALVGAVGCLGAMLLINFLWSVVAIAAATICYLLIVRFKIRVSWGNVGSGVAYQRARVALLKLEQERFHPKNWRPSILALSGGAYNRVHLATYAWWLTRKSGVVTIAQIIRGDLDKLLDRQREAESILRKFIRTERLGAFPVVVVDENMHAAVQALLQCHGLGGLRPNTLMLGWSRDAANSAAYAGLLTLVKRMRRSLIIVASKQQAMAEHAEVPSGDINIWWSDDRNGALMLLLAFLLRQNRRWRGKSIRILRTLPPKGDVQGVTMQMQQMLLEARMVAEIRVMATADRLVAVKEAMQPSAVLFAGFEAPDTENAANVLSALTPVADLPCDVLLVYSAGEAALNV